MESWKRKKREWATWDTLMGRRERAERERERERERENGLVLARFCVRVHVDGCASVCPCGAARFYTVEER